MQAGNRIEISWINQPGRLVSRMESIADGFHGSSVIAGVAAVAENNLPDSGFAEKAVAIARDAFAEGVAYGAEDVFRDAVEEINLIALDEEPDSFSFAVAAVLGDRVWVYSMGTCRVFLSGDDSVETGKENVVDLSGKGICPLKLKPGQSIILLTCGLRKLMGSTAAMKYSSHCGKPLPFCLSEMIRETRIRFRKKGGSAAAVRLCDNSGRVKLSRMKYLIFLLAFVLAVAVILTLCRGSGEKHDFVRADSIITGEIVMPLD